MSGNAQHRKKTIPTNSTKDPSSKFRDDISPPLVANLVNRTYDVLHGPSRGAKDEECRIEQSGNLVNWMWNRHLHNALYASPESSPGYTVKDMITPKVSPDLPSRGKDETSPPNYPPGIIHRIRGGAPKTKSKKEPKTKSPPAQKAKHTQHRKKSILANNTKNTQPIARFMESSVPANPSGLSPVHANPTSSKGKDEKVDLMKPAAWKTPWVESQMVSHSAYDKTPGSSSGYRIQCETYEPSHV